MRLAWSKSTLPLSVLIRWGLGEPCSHFVIVFQDRFMFQSNLLGTGLDYWPYFKSKEAEIVHEIPISIDKDIEEKLYDQIIMQFGHKQYDWLGFCYFIWRGFLKRVFNRPMPAKNKWAQPNQFLCVGLMKSLDLEGIPTWFRQVVQRIPDCEMISPEALYQLILKAEREQTVEAMAKGLP